MIRKPDDVRLCLAARLFYPVYAGGALRFARYLPGLAERGIETHVFTATAGSVRTRMSGLTDEAEQLRPGERLPVVRVNDAPVHRVRLPTRTGDVRRGMAFGRYLARFCAEPDNRPDVVQVLAPALPLIPALRQLRRLGIPVLSGVTVAPHEGRGVRARTDSIFYALPTRYMDGLVVSSETLCRRLAGMGVKAPMTVIANGVDTTRFRPARPADSGRLDLRSRLGIAPSDIALITVGAVTPRKNTELLLEAWCRLATEHPTLHLIIVGPRKDTADPALAAFHERIEALLAASGAAGRVRFTGVIEDIDAYYRAADAFVFTSRREGMPNAMLEAMASGLPVVTTPFVGMAAELGTPGRDFIMADFKPEAFAAAVERLVVDPSARVAIGAAARRWVERNMDLGRSLDRYAELYRGFTRQDATATRSPAAHRAALVDRAFTGS